MYKGLSHCWPNLLALNKTRPALASPSRCISKWEWAASHNHPLICSVFRPATLRHPASITAYTVNNHRRSKHSSSKANMDWPGTLETTDNNGLRIAVEGCVSNN